MSEQDVTDPIAQAAADVAAQPKKPGRKPLLQPRNPDERGVATPRGHKKPASSTEVSALKEQVAALTALVEAQAQATPAGMTPELFLKAMERQAEILRGNKELDVEIAATINAQAMKKALRPENEIAPGISVYNDRIGPNGKRGERDNPRPKPTHIYMLARYPICDPGNYDTTTWTEIELLNQLKAGSYTVTKGDGLDVKVLVKTEMDSADKPYKTTLFADGKGIQDDEQKNNWPPLLQILTQMVTGEGPMQSYARYQAIIDRLTAENAALKQAAAASAA